MIPILDLTRQYKQIQAELESKVLAQLASGSYILGPTVEKFETAMADYLNTQHTLGVASGTDALYLALLALDIGPGDEVITTPFTYVATSESIQRAGAKPVFIDIDANTFNMNLNLLEAAITPKTKAIIPVHLYGLSVDMTGLMAIAKKHNLYVVEDCAQALGATWQSQKVGTFGDIGCYSFFPTKNLGAAGDGGLVSTNNTELYEKLKMLRVHGAKTRYDHQLKGINSRLDALQACILQVKLPYLDNWNKNRQEIAAFYNAELKDTDGVSTPSSLPNAEHVFHQYTIQVENRDAVYQALTDADVQAMIYYPIPLHLQGLHKELGYTQGAFPVTERVASKVLSLPIYPELTAEERQTVVNAVKNAVRQPALQSA